MVHLKIPLGSPAFACFRRAGGSVIPFKPRKARAPAPPASVATRLSKPKARPSETFVVYRAVEGRPIHWQDGFGIVHTCEVTETTAGLVAWTMCDKDVHDTAQYVSNDLDEVTCPRCAQERWVPRDPDGGDVAWLPDYKPGA